MDNQTAHALIEKNMFVFQKYLFNLHNIWNCAALGQSNLHATCQNVETLTNFIEECTQNIMKISQSRENYVPWLKVKKRKRSKSQEAVHSKRARFD